MNIRALRQGLRTPNIRHCAGWRRTSDRGFPVRPRANSLGVGALLRRVGLANAFTFGFSLGLSLGNIVLDACFGFGFGKFSFKLLCGRSGGDLEDESIGVEAATIRLGRSAE